MSGEQRLVSAAVAVAEHFDTLDDGRYAIADPWFTRLMAATAAFHPDKFTVVDSPDMDGAARAAFDAFYAEGTEYSETERAMFRQVAQAVIDFWNPPEFETALLRAVRYTLLRYEVCTAAVTDLVAMEQANEALGALSAEDIGILRQWIGTKRLEVAS